MARGKGQYVAFWFRLLQSQTGDGECRVGAAASFRMLAAMEAVAQS